MPQRGRRNSDKALLMALACGATVEVAAQKAGISQATAYRRAKEPEFQKELREIQAEMVKRTAGALTAASQEGVKTLLALLQPTIPHAVRLGAARAVLEHAQRFRETATLEERMTALEEQLVTMSGGG
jgi:hypothetical protein